MSLALAFAGSRCTVVASDRSRVEAPPGCRFSETLDKAFVLQRNVLGGVVGLLEINGKTTKSIIDEADLTECRTIDDVACGVTKALLDALAECDEISFEHRKVDVVLIGPVDLVDGRRLTVRGLRLTPNAALTEIRVEPSADVRYLVMGDDSATAAVRAELAGSHSQLAGYGRKRLTEAVETIVAKGIAASGPHPHCPQHPACAGRPHHVYRTF